LQPTPQSRLEQRFERELQRDHRLRRLFGIGSWIVAFSTIATLLILIIPLGRTSPWLIMLSLYSVATRILAALSWKAFLYPRFLLLLEDRDPNVASVAAAVLERHRPAVVRPILEDLLRPADAAAVAAMDTTELASLARQYGVERRRRVGRRWLVAWCVLSLVVWGTVIATGGGPTG
jgi:hypothetical protein